ncbi:MAG: glycosyltransferase family A protein [Amaricoccus sp.]
MLSVIIPANNEADYIGSCLEMLLASDPLPQPAEGPAVEIIVVANGCTDATAAVAESYRMQAEAKGWPLIVLDLAQGDKLRALNAGERAARGSILAYIDADIAVSPPLLAQLQAVLNRPEPAYASGRPRIAPARSWISRTYARFWMRVPFMTDAVPGCGVFAMNAAGRARWGDYPQIISDDTFTRLQFTPEERFGVPACYTWPIAEGFGRLVRVRRRQDVGVAEVARLYPALMQNEHKPRVGLRRLTGMALGDPVGFAVYGAVALAVRLPRGGAKQAWSRGR